MCGQTYIRSRGKTILCDNSGISSFSDQVGNKNCRVVIDSGLFMMDSSFDHTKESDYEDKEVWRSAQDAVITHLSLPSVTHGIHLPRDVSLIRI